MRKVIRRRDAQRVAEHVHGYLRATRRAALDAIASWDHGEAPPERGLLHSILHTEILEQVTRYEKAFPLSDVTGVEMVLDETLISRDAREYHNIAELYTHEALRKPLGELRGLDGKEFSPLAMARRAFMLTQPLKYQSNEEFRAGTAGAKLLQVVSPELWTQLIKTLEHVISVISDVLNDESGRMRPLYRVLAKYVILYGMALVHEVIEGSGLETSTPLAWNRPLLDQQILERHREQLTLLRQVLYTGGGMYMPASVSSRSHWNMLWTALSAVEQETSYESAQ